MFSFIPAEISAEGDHLASQNDDTNLEVCQLPDTTDFSIEDQLASGAVKEVPTNCYNFNVDCEEIHAPFMANIFEEPNATFEILSNSVFGVTEHKSSAYSIPDCLQSEQPMPTLTIHPPCQYFATGDANPDEEIHGMNYGDYFTNIHPEDFNMGSMAHQNVDENDLPALEAAWDVYEWGNNILNEALQYLGEVATDAQGLETAATDAQELEKAATNQLQLLSDPQQVETSSHFEEELIDGDALTFNQLPNENELERGQPLKRKEAVGGANVHIRKLRRKAALISEKKTALMAYRTKKFLREETNRKRRGKKQRHRSTMYNAILSGGVEEGIIIEG